MGSGKTNSENNNFCVDSGVRVGGCQRCEEVFPLFTVSRVLDLEQSGSAGIVAAGVSFQEQFVRRTKRSTWDEEREVAGSNANWRDLGEVLAFFEHWRRSVSVQPQ
jgi:hypothetical protein